MNKKFNLLIVSLMVIGLLAACSPVSAPTSPENLRSLNVSGSGRVTVVPDIATINIGVRTEADAVADALQGNTTQANAITAVLKDMDIAVEDIQTSNFNVYPSERYDPMTGQVEGRFFVVENTVNVTVRNLSSLGAVLSAVIEAGANNIYGINFNVDDREAAVAEARQLAIKDAQGKAQSIADAAGVELGELINISVYNGSAPMFYDGKGGTAYAAEEAAPISAGTLTIIMESNLTYEIQ